MTEAPRDSKQAAGRPDGGAGSDKAPKRDLRHEVKFVAPPTQRASLEAWLHGHGAGFHRAYPPRRVNNFYLDDFDLSTYEENLAGVSSRTKVRFRWYGNSPDEVAGTLELKRKRNRLGWKEHYRVPALRIRDRSWTRIMASLRSQLPLEARVWLDNYPHPTLINQYDRHYYVSRDGLIRVTLDGNQRVFDQRLARNPNLRAATNLPDLLIVEFKASSSDALRLGRAIQGIPIRGGRHSKYVVGVQSMTPGG